MGLKKESPGAAHVGAGRHTGQIDIAHSGLSPQELLRLKALLEALCDQRDVLEHRIWLGDSRDEALEWDCRVWCQLADAVADFLEARRAS
jgi:hypothetical protein